MRSAWRVVLVAMVVAGAIGCGLDPNKVPSLSVYAQHEDVITTDRAVVWALIGGTAGASSSATETVIADLRAELPIRDVQGVVLTGNHVARSSTAEWQAFATRFANVVDGPMASSNQARKPALAIPGDGERLGDRRLKGIGAAFPDQFVDIGHNRVASWGFVDITSKGETWRILFVDSRRGALGSRWEEQLFWLPKAVVGDHFDHILVFMTDPLVTLARGTVMDRDGGPSTLLEVIDDHAGIGKVKAVFASGSGTNEFFLPTGAYGEAFVVVGNGGVGAPNLRRWAQEPDLPFDEVTHEALFGLAVVDLFDKWADAYGYNERLRQQAHGTGSWEGFTAEIDGAALPIQGWWELRLDGGLAQLTLRTRQADDSMADLFYARCEPNGVWSTSRP